MLTEILGLAQLGFGIWQMIDQQKQEDKMLKEERRRVNPNELWQSKKLVQDMYRGAASSRKIREAEIEDANITRKAISANTAMSPGARLQSDIASNIRATKEKANVWDQYRQERNQITAEELNLNSDIARNQLAVNDQNLALARAKQEQENIRTNAWSELMNAGISNVVGAIESRQNQNMMKDIYGVNAAEKANLTKKATDMTTAGDMTQEQFDEFNEILATGNMRKAARYIQSITK